MSSAPKDDFPPDYAERVDRVCSETVTQLRSCRDDLLAQLRVCCRYFENGESQGISHGELVDFLGISSPSLLDQAGYSDSEAQRIMESLVLITYDSKGRAHPPTSIPASSNAPPAKQTDLQF